MTEQLDLPQGTLDLLILNVVALEPENGWAISKRIRQRSRDALQVRQGSLYPALHRLEHRGLIKARWGRSENNRRARIYEITHRGQQHRERETGRWQQLTVAVAHVLEGAS